MEITDSMIEELRMGAITAIDGLWFLNVEKRLGFDDALEIDIDVWRDYGVIQLKRLAKRLGITIDPDNPPELETINLLLEGLCRIEGTEGEGEVIDENTSTFRVHKCVWWENLQRAGRENLVPCEMIDEKTFHHWLAVVDPSLKMRITHSLPRGDDYCAWTLKRPER